jgi:hypothetical protein
LNWLRIVVQYVLLHGVEHSHDMLWLHGAENTDACGTFPLPAA